ncbi:MULTISPECIES: ABC transporter substrate-binding protein [Roseomonadaceae]|uniref:ABC transporter substrate-binding protein n=1 Tax=Falsiroseomonas oleicola TaxID=2801474 RepID=A0ABS6H2W0_9PROT|nr:ABC transporter substrate-binding protein [Roseomonas oleicola]MBU8542078.1 ABC transporter substrate-binding protein [Roseomonas oleicola]
MRLPLLAIALAIGASPAVAQELRVGLAANITSLDPHFHVIGSNSALARNIFDGLVNQDDRQQLTPGLAESWRAVDGTTWEFTLREGARFHDGAPVTAEDVAASLRRIPKVRNSPSSFLPFVRPITGISVVDARTLRLTTAEPFPLLPGALSRIAILPAAAEAAETSDLNAGRGLVGTGPYRFQRSLPGDRVELAAMDPANPWQRVSFRFVPNNPARVAGLLAGDLDLIEQVPTADAARLRRDSRITMASAASNRVMYLHPDHDRATTPFATAKDGSAIPNPLRDVRVRRALSLAINRAALVDRVMDGEGAPAGQLVPEGYFGHAPTISAPAFDLAGARRLLTEAGLPNGFALTLHASNDRYPNDEKVAQALGQMWSRAGIQTQVVVQPGSVFFTRASARDYTLIMGGAAAETGEASSVMRPLLATFDTARGDGSGNRGRYSNPDFDRLLRQALTAVEDQAREALLRQATELAMQEMGVIPVFFLSNTWASRGGVTYRPRSDGYTLAGNAGR